MNFRRRFFEFFLGKPRNPFRRKDRHRIALASFWAWIGLGADGLSSSCYGPEQAFIALGSHTALALYIALATIITIFVISLAYNQVIELFPGGGGGYRVATQLLGARAGLIAGASLLVDYVLTIAISVSSGVDALCSFLPSYFLSHKLIITGLVIGVLTWLNLRGTKESIQLLMPIFLGFIVTHALLIGYGFCTHESLLGTLWGKTIESTRHVYQEDGWIFLTALLLRAYCLGGGTYTGIEAVSNNVNRLAEPRAQTGKWTMSYMAISLSLMAGGIILLYLLYQVQVVPGKTLNALVFEKILGESIWAHGALAVTLFLEAGLLFIGANTGFLGGPSVLSHMAIDNWVPKRFRYLSSRLVSQNGIIVFGLAALVVLVLSEGQVSWLAVLYSINVFVSFSLSILGLCIYWYTQRGIRGWFKHFLFSVGAFFLSVSILIVTLIEKFSEGGWITIVITAFIIHLCLITRKHYTLVNKKLRKMDQVFTDLHPAVHEDMDFKKKPIAVLMIHQHIGVGVHSLLEILRIFPDCFKHFIFLTAAIVDIKNFPGQRDFSKMKQEVNHFLDYFIKLCSEQGLAAESLAIYGTDTVEELTKTAQQILVRFPGAVFFATRIILGYEEGYFLRHLHNETLRALQQNLHVLGIPLIILPIKPV